MDATWEPGDLARCKIGFCDKSDCVCNVPMPPSIYTVLEVRLTPFHLLLMNPLISPVFLRLQGKPDWYGCDHFEKMPPLDPEEIDVPEELENA